MWSDLTSNTDVLYYTLQSVEAGVVLQRFTATDNDLGTNSALEYSLQQIQPSGETEVRVGRGLALRSKSILNLLMSIFKESFSIHRYTGDLSVTQALSLGDEFLLTITVRVSPFSFSLPPPPLSLALSEVKTLTGTGFLSPMSCIG